MSFFGKSSCKNAGKSCAIFVVSLGVAYWLAVIFLNERDRDLFVYVLTFLSCIAALCSVIFVWESKQDTKKLIAAIEEATDEIRYLRKTINAMTQRGNTKPIAK